MVGMCDRRLAVSMYPVLHIAPSFMRLKSIFAKDVCDFGASISRGRVLLVGGVFTGVRIVFSSTSNVLYRAGVPLPGVWVRETGPGEAEREDAPD